MTITAAAGEPIPSGLSSKAKAIGNAITLIVGVVTSGAALALIPDDVVSDAQVLGAGALITSIVQLVVTYLVPNKLTAPIEVTGDLPGKHAAP